MKAKAWKYLAVIGIVVVAAAVAAVTAGGPDLTGRLPLARGTDAGKGTRVALAAEGVDEIGVFGSESGGSSRESLPARTEYGTRASFAVISEKGDRVEVRLPGRPNGRTGWMEATDVSVRSVSSGIDIDLGSRKVRAERDGEVVLEADVAIGSDRYPTPKGDFYVTDVLRSDDPAYGDWAFGISAWSESLTDFNGGSGQIGIHGTNDPSSIGDAVSHGCIRVDNDVAAALSDVIELGTPVSIH